MAAKDHRLYLLHIQEGCDKILDYTRELGPEWPTSPVLVDAACRNTEIIGEAATGWTRSSGRRMPMSRGGA